MTSAIPSYRSDQEDISSEYAPGRRGEYASFQKKRNEANLPRSDWWLIVTVMALIMLGLLMVYSSTYKISYYVTSDQTTTTYLYRQAQWVGLGSLVLLCCWRIDYRIWQRWSTIFMIGILFVLLALPLSFIGKESFGASRWLVAGGSVQPSEAAKLITVIYVAHWASSKGERLQSVQMGLIPFGVLIGIVCGLIMIQPSFSAGLLVGMVATTMFFIAGADLKQLMIAGSISALMLFLIGISAAYRLKRFQAFIDPFGTEDGVGYQTAQVLYSLARGGILGEGLGTSKGNVPALPAGHTDFIFAIIGQELGLLFCLLVLGLFLFLGYRGFRIAINAPDAFGMVLACGLTSWFLYQALMNIAVVTNSIPPTGIPLPFISFGGSGMVTALAGVGLLLSISRAQPLEIR